MRHLAKRYRALSAEEVLVSLREGRPLPSKAVLVTFDDAYRDFGEVAWPIMRRHGLPATLFVPTAYPDRPDLEFWWDRLYRVFRLTTRRVLLLPALGELRVDSAPARLVALKAVEKYLKSISHSEAMRTVDDVCSQLGDPGEPTARVLGWRELRALTKDGVTLAAHTRTHPALPRLPEEHARAEIRGSREDLRREIGEVAPIFAYPFGAHDDGIVRLVREEGFELALTCLDGHNRWQTSEPLRLRRTNISTRTGSLVFRARLTPLVSYVDMWRHRHERSNIGGS